MLLILGGAGAAAGALVAAPFRATIAQRARELATRTGLTGGALSLADGSYEQWLAQVGSTFSVGGGGSMRLAGVRALQSGGVRPAGIGRSRAFVAMFDPLARATMAGDLIYTANHSQYGPLQIFMSASPDPRTPARMLAVFN